MNNWLTRYALQAQGSGSAKTLVVMDGEKLAGYFSLTLGLVDSTEMPFPIKVVILARLAVAESSKGKGIRRGMLQDAIKRTCLISEQAGIRALLTHPLDEAAKDFYLRFGFQQSPIREGQLILLLKDAIKLLN